MPTSVRLDDKTEAILLRLAAKSGKTKSAIIREAIERYERETTGSRPSLYDELVDLIGVGHGGDPQLAERSEEILRGKFRKKESKS